MERFHFKKKIMLVYLVWAIILFFSFLLNVDKADTFQNILFNFSIPLYFLFIGLSLRGVPTWLKYSLVTVGTIYLLYLALYYLDGLS